MSSLNKFIEYCDVVTTTNISTQQFTNAAYTVPTGAIVRMIFRIQGQENTTKDAVAFVGQALIKNISGTLTPVGSFSYTDPPIGLYFISDDSGALSGCNANYTTSGTSVIPTVTGADSTVINWQIFAEYYIL